MEEVHFIFVWYFLPYTGFYYLFCIGFTNLRFLTSFCCLANVHVMYIYRQILRGHFNLVCIYSIRFMFRMNMCVLKKILIERKYKYQWTENMKTRFGRKTWREFDVKQAKFEEAAKLAKLSNNKVATTKKKTDQINGILLDLLDSVFVSSFLLYGFCLYLRFMPLIRKHLLTVFFFFNFRCKESGRNMK